MSSVSKPLLGTETVQLPRPKGARRGKSCGLSANDLRENFVSAGADDFILKPTPRKKEELREMPLKLLGVSAQGPPQSLVARDPTTPHPWLLSSSHKCIFLVVQSVVFFGDFDYNTPWNSKYEVFSLDVEDQ